MADTYRLNLWFKDSDQRKIKKAAKAAKSSVSGLLRGWILDLIENPPKPYKPEPIEPMGGVQILIDKGKFREAEAIAEENGWTLRDLMLQRLNEK